MGSKICALSSSVFLLFLIFAARTTVGAPSVDDTDVWTYPAARVDGRPVLLAAATVPEPLTAREAAQAAPGWAYIPPQAPEHQNIDQDALRRSESLVCNCQKWAASYLGLAFGYVRAALIPATTTVCREGAAILTRENSAGVKEPTGHVGVVLDCAPDGRVTFVEANFSRCRVTVRTLAMTDPRIRGYWEPPV